jgi:uncharacterized membrane protein YjgN (DUF898 family)
MSNENLANDSDARSPAQIASLQQMLHYDGKLGDLYRIYLVNLLLTIVTLGIWRFWGITRLRRYVWSRTSMAGDRFEYDGTGLQLFLSFLLAGLVLVGMFIVAVLLSVLLHRYSPHLAVVPILLLELVILVLALGAPFSAQRYRLGHSLWRGIRGGMEGSAIHYGLRSLAYFLLAAVTLYQLLPWAALRLREQLISASFLGDLRLHARGRPGQLYLIFLATFVGVIVLGLAVAGTVWALDGAGLRAMMTVNAQGRGAAPNPEMGRLVRHAIYYVIGGYVAFFFGAALISCAYAAAFWRHLLAHTTAGTIQFGSAVAARDLFVLIGGNFLILIPTLGLGYPIVIQRNARFFTGNLLASSTPDPATLRQSDRPVPTLGEGMFQQLDAGAGFL